MWLLTLITIVNGGEGPTKFEEYTFQTKEKCIQVQHQKETAVTYGYCNKKEK